MIHLVAPTFLIRMTALIAFSSVSTQLHKKNFKTKNGDSIVIVCLIFCRKEYVNVPLFIK